MMKTKERIFETDPLSEKTISGEKISVSIGSDDKEKSSSQDLNFFRKNRLRGNNNVSYRNSLENFEKNRSKTKYPFIVDWQIPET